MHSNILHVLKTQVEFAPGGFPLELHTHLLRVTSICSWLVRLSASPAAHEQVHRATLRARASKEQPGWASSHSTEHQDRTVEAEDLPEESGPGHHYLTVRRMTVS